MKKLANKTALVTGGSRGIGAAIAKRLAAEGANVAFTSTNASANATAVADSIKAAGGKALAIVADSARPEDVINAVTRTVTEFGGIDILVNNAGVYNGKAFEEHTLADYEQVMGVNVRAVFVAANEAAKHMKTGGRVITIGSNMADNAVSEQTTLYTMSKSALQGFTRGLARDLGPKGITANLVQPGPIDTDMNPDGSELSVHLKSRMPLGQYGTGDDIASMVAYLASDEARQINGTSITIDGGFNA